MARRVNPLPGPLMGDGARRERSAVAERLARPILEGVAAASLEDVSPLVLRSLHVRRRMGEGAPTVGERSVDADPFFGAEESDVFGMFRKE